jgi:26S proteasome regulatory subunit N1
LALKEQLELYVVRAQDADAGVQKLALESMRYELDTRFSFFSSRVGLCFAERSCGVQKGD